MAFNDTYRESIQTKHISNVGFTSTAKGVTNEAYISKNPHQVLASQIPAIDVVSTYGPTTDSGIAAGVVEEHIVKLTADPTVNENKAWIATETNCTTSGHAARGAIRIDQWMRYAETQYKLRLFEDDGSGTAPNMSAEILPSETTFNWEYDPSTGVVYFDENPADNGKTLPLWGKFYTYIGATVFDGLGTVSTHNHDDRYYTETEVDNLIASGIALTDANASYVSDTVWSYGTDLDGIPDRAQIYVNGVKQHIGSAYDYTLSLVSGTLMISFTYSVHSTDWVNIISGNNSALNIDFNLVEDTSPQLGGDLDANGHAIVAADHGTATSPQVVNVIYSTSAPTVSGVANGTICIVYTP